MALRHILNFSTALIGEPWTGHRQAIIGGWRPRRSNQQGAATCGWRANKRRRQGPDPDRLADDEDDDESDDDEMTSDSPAAAIRAHERARIRAILLHPAAAAKPIPRIALGAQ
jgi:hypothetical protein